MVCLTMSVSVRAFLCTVTTIILFINTTAGQGQWYPYTQCGQYYAENTGNETCDCGGKSVDLDTQWCYAMNCSQLNTVDVICPNGSRVMEKHKELLKTQCGQFYLISLNFGYGLGFCDCGGNSLDPDTQWCYAKNCNKSKANDDAIFDDVICPTGSRVMEKHEVYSHNTCEDDDMWPCEDGECIPKEDMCLNEIRETLCGQYFTWNKTCDCGGKIVDQDTQWCYAMNCSHDALDADGDGDVICPNGSRVMEKHEDEELLKTLCGQFYLMSFNLGYGLGFCDCGGNSLDPRTQWCYAKNCNKSEGNVICPNGSRVMEKHKEQIKTQCGQFSLSSFNLGLGFCDCGGNSLDPRTQWCYAKNCNNSEGNVICPNGSKVMEKHEENSHYTCKDDNMWPCEDGECIRKKDMCRGDKLCMDGSDVRACYKDITWPQYCPTCPFFSGQCYDSGLFGNQIVNCLDRTENKYVTLFQETYSRDHWCSDVNNPSSWIKVLSEGMCDGVADCYDNSDEDPELCKERHYGKVFTCKDGRTIKGELVCNKKTECLDGSDEDVEICKWRPFTCDDGKASPGVKLCDGFVHCDDQSDEDPVRCKETYISIRLQKPGGHIVCNRSEHVKTFANKKYEIPILAVACDGNRECVDGEDERSCTLLSWPARISIAVFLTIFFTNLSIVLGKHQRFLSGNICSPVAEGFSDLIYLHNGQYEIKVQAYLDCHWDGTLQNFLSDFLSFLCQVLPEKERRTFSRKVFHLERMLHGGSKVQAKICLFNSGHNSKREVATILQDADTYPSKLIETTRECLTQFSSFLQHSISFLKSMIPFSCQSSTRPSIFKNICNLAKHTLSMVLYYMDLWKDIMLVYSILVFAMQVPPVQENPIFLGIVSVLIGTIMMPNLIYGVSLAMKAKQENTGMSRFQQFLMFLVSPIIPAVKLYHVNVLSTSLYDTYEDMSRKGQVCEDSVKKTRSLNFVITKLQNELIEFKKIELSFEVVYQISVQLILIAWSITKFPVHDSSRSVFSPDSSLSTSLELQIGLSMVISSITILKISDVISANSQQAGLGLRILNLIPAILFSLSKTAAIVSFFTPTLGLFGIMAHFVVEKNITLIWDRRGLATSDFGNYSYLDGNHTVVTIPWSMLERGTSRLHRPEPTLYTGLDLRSWFFVFCAISCVHLFLVFGLKVGLSSLARSEWKKSATNLVLHVLQNKNFILVLRPWTTCSTGTISQVKKLWKEERREVLALTVLHLAENLLFLTPLWYTVPRIRERHELIVAALPRVFDAENEAYDLGNLLVWLMPLLFTISAGLQYLIYWISNEQLHPFRDLIQDDDDEENVFLPKAEKVKETEETCV